MLQTPASDPVTTGWRLDDVPDESSPFAGSNRAAASPSGSAGPAADRQELRARHAESLTHRADTDVMRAVAGGSQEAFAELYDRYAVRVHGLVRRVVRDPAQSEDVAHQVFVEAWRRARCYDPATDAVADWLLTMAHLRAIERVRSDQTARDRAWRAGDRQILPRADEADEHGETDRRHESVRAALNELTELERDAIELAYVRGSAYRETAALLDTPPGTVTSALREGLLRLSRAWA